MQAGRRKYGGQERACGILLKHLLSSLCPGVVNNPEASSAKADVSGLQINGSERKRKRVLQSLCRPYTPCGIAAAEENLFDSTWDVSCMVAFHPRTGIHLASYRTICKHEDATPARS